MRLAEASWMWIQANRHRMYWPRNASAGLSQSPHHSRLSCPGCYCRSGTTLQSVLLLSGTLGCWWTVQHFGYSQLSLVPVADQRIDPPISPNYAISTHPLQISFLHHYCHPAHVRADLRASSEDSRTCQGTYLQMKSNVWSPYRRSWFLKSGLLKWQSIQIIAGELV